MNGHTGLTESQTATHPDFAGPIRFTAEPQSADNNQATAQTIDRMRQYAVEDSTSPGVQSTLLQAVPSVIGDKLLTARLIFSWVHRHVRFRTDAATAAEMTPRPAEPFSVELLIRPRDLVRMSQPTGDCDDFSMLTASLLTAAGIRSEFVTIAADADAPQNWSHVYVNALIQGRRIAMDTSHGPRFGWAYSKAFRSQAWPLQQQPEGSMTLNGLGFADPEDDSSYSPANWWQQLVATGEKIATNRYGQAPAVQYQTNAQGTTYTQYQPQATGKSSLPQFSIPGISATGNSSSLLIIGAVALVAIVLFSKK